MATIGELFVKLGFDVDDIKLKSFKEDIGDGLASLLKMTAAAAGAVYAVDRFVDGSIRSAVALRNFNMQTGLSIEQLQKWQVATTMSNTAASVEQVTASVQALQEAIGDVAMGKGGGPFSMLGIDVRGKDAFDVLEEMRARYADNVKTWGQTQTIGLMRQTGIDPAMLEAITMTREEFDKLASSQLLGMDAQRRLVDLGRAVADTKRQFGLFKDQLSADIAPSLISFLEQVVPMLQEFWQIAKDLTVSLKEMWASFPDEAKTNALLAFIGALMLLNPLATSLALIAVAIYDISKAVRGLPSFSGSKLADLLDFLFISEPGSDVDELKKRLRAAQQGRTDLAPSAPSPDYSARGAAENIGPGGPLRLTVGQQSQGVTFNNQYDIKSMDDPEAVADMVVRAQQRQFNYALDEQNNGARY